MTIRSGDRSSASERACWPRAGDPPLSEITDAEWDGQRFTECFVAGPRKGKPWHPPWWKPRSNYEGWSWSWHLVRHHSYDTHTRRRLHEGDPMIPGRYIHGGTSLTVTFNPRDLRVGIRIGRWVWRRLFARWYDMHGRVLDVTVNMPMVSVNLLRSWSGP